MKKFFVLAGISALMSITTLNAQVTIGSHQIPNPDAVLELVTPENNKGFLPSRIALVAPDDPAPLSAHVPGMVVYNTNVVAGVLQEGLYVNDGTRWLALQQTPYLIPTWFYMPSFPINVSVAGDFEVNVWEEYDRQFNDLAAGNVIARSDVSVPKPLPKVYAAGELHFYVVGYDTTVFTNVAITPAGLLKYSITPANLANVSDATYMNILFVVK